jgi:hypothetical protein
MSCRTEAGVERNKARAISTCVPRVATATRLLNPVLGVDGYSGFRRESKITREVDHNTAIEEIIGVDDQLRDPEGA